MSAGSVELAQVGSSMLLRWATWLALLGIVLCLVDRLLCVVVLGLALLVAGAGIAWRLFGVCQIRTSELLILIAILGNVVGWSISGIRAELSTTRHVDVVVYGLLLAGFVVWFCGGWTTGLIVAKALKQDRLPERLALVFIFVLYPLGIFGSVASVVAVLIGIAAANPGLILIAGLIGIGSAHIWMWGSNLRRQARQVATSNR